MENKYPNLRGIPYEPDENGIAKRVMCPLVDDWVDDIDCMENQDSPERNIPDRFKTKKEWKKLCKSCPFREY